MYELDDYSKMKQSCLTCDLCEAKICNAKQTSVAHSKDQIEILLLNDEIYFGYISGFDATPWASSIALAT